jgi:hypothetical protein
VPRCRSLIPGTVNTYGVTHDKMSLLDAMDVQDGCIVHGEVDPRHGCQEVQDDGCRGEGGRPLVAGTLLVLLTKIASDLPLDDGLHQ